MSYTYNQILKKLETISLSNPFVKRFGSGEIQQLDVVAPNETDYPYTWVVPQSVSIGENTLNYKFRVMVFDQDDTDDHNQQEILSDTLRTLIDIIKTFRYDNGDDYNLGVQIPEAFPFTHRIVDYAGGGS